MNIVIKEIDRVWQNLSKARADVTKAKWLGYASVYIALDQGGEKNWVFCGLAIATLVICVVVGIVSHQAANAAEAYRKSLLEVK